MRLGLKVGKWSKRIKTSLPVAVLCFKLLNPVDSESSSFTSNAHCPRYNNTSEAWTKKRQEYKNAWKNCRCEKQQPKKNINPPLPTSWWMSRALENAREWRKAEQQKGQKQKQTQKNPKITFEFKRNWGENATYKMIWTYGNSGKQHETLNLNQKCGCDTNVMNMHLTRRGLCSNMSLPISEQNSKIGDHVQTAKSNNWPCLSGEKTRKMGTAKK